MKKEMLGEGPGKAEMVGVYEELGEVEFPKIGQYKEEFAKMGSGDKDKKGQWREYWASHR